MYKIVRTIVYAISLLPFRLLYVLSDATSAVLYHIVRYRRAIVRQNLKTSFPDKSAKEIKTLERQFYRWFADYVYESFKLLSISDKELRRRFKVINVEEVKQCFDEGQDCGALLGHYCNWEWLSCIGIALPDDVRTGLVYHPLRSSVAEPLFRDIRSSQPSSLIVPKNDILRSLLTLKQNNTRNIFGYIADQGPKWTNIHLWLTFFGKDTPVFTGAERIMRKMNDAVFYVEMNRPRRGYYTCTFRLITRQPGEEEEFAITRRFFAMLEETIRRNPAYYLWTHNRWKRTHAEFLEHFHVVNGKVVRNDSLPDDGAGDEDDSAEDAAE